MDGGNVGGQELHPQRKIEGFDVMLLGLSSIILKLKLSKKWTYQHANIKPTHTTINECVT